MLGTIPDVKVILLYPSQLQKEHKDPYVLDQDNNIMQESLESKSYSKWQKIMLGTILNVMVILPYPPQLQEEQKDLYVLDQDNNIIQESLVLELWRIKEDDHYSQDCL